MQSYYAGITVSNNKITTHFTMEFLIGTYGILYFPFYCYGRTSLFKL